MREIPTLLALCALASAQLLPFPDQFRPFPTPPEPNGTFALILPSTVKRNEAIWLRVRALSGLSTVASQDWAQIQVLPISANDPPRAIGSPTSFRLTSAVMSTESGQITYLPQSADTYGLRLNVTATFSNGHRFHKQEYVNFNYESEPVFIQTDRSVYKPGSTVRYRVVAVRGPELLPASGTADISIFDPQRNRIRRQRGVGLVGGIISDTLKLADEPPLGSWSIEVSLNNGTQGNAGASFTVERYVLPKFSVELGLPKFITRREGLEATIEAKYTHGGGVEGTYSLSIGDGNSFPFPSPPIGLPFEGAPMPYGRPSRGLVKTGNLDKSGKTVVRISNAELTRLNLLGSGDSSYGHYVSVNAKIVEKNTGTEEEESGSFQAYQNRNKLKITSDGGSAYSMIFKPGFSSQLKIALLSQDDAPVLGSSNRQLRRVQVTVTYSQVDDYGPPPLPVPFFASAAVRTSSEQREMKSVILDARGEATFSVSPSQDIASIRVEARLSDAGASLTTETTLSAFRSRSKEQLKIELLGSSRIRILASRGLAEEGPGVSLLLVGQGGRLLEAPLGSYAVGASAAYTLSFLERTTERATLVAFAYFGPTKEIIADSISIPARRGVGGRSKTSIAFSRPEAEDGEAVGLTVMTAPGAFVGILAVDKSSSLLRPNYNDITATSICQRSSQPCEEGDEPIGPYPMPFGRRAKRSIMPWNPVASDTRSVFNMAGLTLVTDALVEGDFFGGYGGGGIMPMTAQVGDGGPPMPAPRGPQPSVEGAAGFGGGAPAGRLRKSFPETWIWADERADRSGFVRLNQITPDTMTSWIATAFSLHPTAGLSATEEPATLVVRKTLFVTVAAPYSVKRGEVFALQVLVSNYHPSFTQIIRVSFESANNSVSITDRLGRPTGQTASRDLTVEANSTGSVHFPVVFGLAGPVQITVRAVSRPFEDSVQRTILVEPEGFKVERSRVLLLDPKGGQQLETVRPEYPANAVPGSKRLDVSVVGDLLGSALSNLDSLVRMPTGCGEQNMVYFVPNIVTLQYFRATNQQNPVIEKKAKEFVEAGYQRELTYKHNDGSYSAFGESDGEGSTWLTAMVVRSFKDAESWTYIDPQILDKGLAFLESRQRMPDGRFEERGSVHSRTLQGAQSGAALSAYTMIAFLKNQRPNPAGLAYLEKTLGSRAQNPYSLAITTYALHLANSPLKDRAFRLLTAAATDDASGRHWRDLGVPSASTSGGYGIAAAADVEMTAYALMATLLRGLVDEAFPIVRWLSAQRNAYGGFASTQDTVIGIEALAMYAERAFMPSGRRLTVQFSGTGASQRFSIDDRSAATLFTGPLDPSTASVSVSGRGVGTAVATVAWSYFIPPSPPAESPFACTNRVRRESRFGSQALKLSLCCRRIRGTEEGMVVAEVGALSGTRFAEWRARRLTETPDVQRVEFPPDSNGLNIYYNTLRIRPICVELEAYEELAVGRQRPAQILVFDYYSPEKRVYPIMISGGEDIRHVKLELEYSDAGVSNRTISELCPDCWQ